MKTYPGADIGTDHNPVVMRFKMQRSIFIKQRSPITSKIDTSKLKNEVRKENIGKSLKQRTRFWMKWKLKGKFTQYKENNKEIRRLCRDGKEKY